MLKTNKGKLPIISVQVSAAHPAYNGRGYYNPDGEMDFLVGTGGIVYNAKIGDNAIDWIADHLEPGVTTKNAVESFNNAAMTYACIGNVAEVISGDAKGALGLVTGKHGGVEHLMVYLPDDAIEKMNIDDKFRIRACGQGLAIEGFAHVVLRSMSPELLDKMNIEECGERLRVGVAKIIPAALMGAGLGSGNSACGDYDITMFDDAAIEKYGLDSLRFGDIIAIMDSDTRYGRTYRGGAVTIGVVVHSNSRSAGHGPGVTTLMSCLDNIIEPFVDEKANLANIFEIE